MKHFILTFLLYSICLHSQEEEDLTHAKNEGYNPEYRLNYFNRMIFQVDVSSDLDVFYIPKLNYTNNSESNFVPNNTIKTKFSFDYKFLGLYLSLSPSFLPGNKTDSKKGKTKTLDLSFKFFYNDRMRQEVIYKSVTGFYLNNPEKEDPIEIFDNLKIQTIGGKTFYILNKNFSYRAFESLTERQIKSNGSFLPSISYFYNKVEVNQPKIAESFLTDIKSYNVYFQMGYMHNFVVYKKWFSTVGVHPGIGFNNFIDYSFDPKTNQKYKSKSKTAHFIMEANFALGYNNKNFFTGIRTNYKNLDFQNKSQVAGRRLNLSIFVGYRFGEHKPVKKAFEYIENHLGI